MSDDPRYDALNEICPVSVEGLVDLCANKARIFVTAYHYGPPEFYEGTAEGLFYQATFGVFRPWDVDQPHSPDLIPDLLLSYPGGTLHYIPINRIEGWTKADAYPALKLSTYADHWQRVKFGPNLSDDFLGEG